MMNDTELLPEFTGSRSEEAFAGLVRRYAGLVYSTAKRRLANPSLAEDITQMVFIRFAKNPPKVRSHAELAAWLHRTTVNASIDLWRSETRRRERELQALVMEPAPSETAIWEEVSPKLDEALNQLNDEDRQALVLRFFSQKTMRELGALLGVSEDAAKMRVSRAVDRLRTQMGVGAAACTVTALATLLTERSLEAAPAQLLARLSAIKLSAAAGLAGAGGVIAFLARTLKLKSAFGAASVALLALITVHFIESRNHPSTNIPAVNSQTEVTSAQPAAANARQPNLIVTKHSSNPTPAPSKVKMLFHVLDTVTGQPIAGAKIEAAYFGIGGMGEGHHPTTDSNGIAVIPEPNDPLKNQGMNVFVAAENHVPMAVGFQGSTTPANYTIKLNRAMTVRGIVVDEQNQPVGGVKITVQGPRDAYGHKQNIDFQTCPVTTESNGTWSCTYVPFDFTNEIRLLLQKTNFAATYPTVPVPDVDLSNLVLVINRGFTVTGRISGSDGQPVADATINRVTAVPGEEQSTKADENGAYILTGVSSDNDNQFSVEPPLETNVSGAILIRGLVLQGTSRSITLAIQGAGFAPKTVTVNLSSTTNIANFTLALSKILRGHVLDEAGRPIPNAIVQTDWDDQGERTFDWQTRTDVDGGFEWDSAPAEPILYWIEADGYQVQRDVSLLADTSDHTIILKK